MATSKENNYPECPMNTAISIIGGKWKLPIIYSLRDGSLRFSQIQKILPQVTQKMLTQQLRELEKDGMVSRKVYAEIPPKVEYSLTLMTKKLEPILQSLCQWGKEYQKIQNKPAKSMKKAC